MDFTHPTTNRTLRRTPHFEDVRIVDMPLPLFASASPHPDRLDRSPWLPARVRSYLQGSSVYTGSPSSSAQNTPKIRFSSFLRRNTPPPELPIHDQRRLDGGMVHVSAASLPLPPPQHTASSYIQDIEASHPAFPATQMGPPGTEPRPSHHARGPSHGSLDPETEQLADLVHRRRRHRHHHHRHTRHHRPQASQWVRRRKPGGDTSSSSDILGTSSKHAATLRSKTITTIIAGLLLASILAIYLAIVLTRHGVGQELQVLFILILLSIAIFFLHSLFTTLLYRRRLHHAPPGALDPPRLPSITSPSGFHPIRPIRVHLARDEEVALGIDAADEAAAAARLSLDEAEKERRLTLLKQPPPAYGLWRCSVPLDPNLLHWQRVEDADPSAATTQGEDRSGNRNQRRSPREQQQPDQRDATDDPDSAPSSSPRPPSYASDDGVTYVVTAMPRSTVYDERNPLSALPASDGGETPSDGIPRDGAREQDVHPLFRGLGA